MPSSLLIPEQAHVTLRRGNLYKYKSLKGSGLDHVIEIIRDCQIYCPRPSQLNDPAECKPQLVIGDIGDPAYWPKVETWVRRCISHRVPPPPELQIQNELASLTQEKLQALVAEASAAYQQAVEVQYRILSLADSCTNHHLWVNYADQYTGVCIRFFVDPFFGSAYRMSYSDEVSALDITLNEGFDALTQTALVKCTAWQNEQEFRLIFREPPLPGDPPLVAQKWSFDRRLMTGLIFGHRVDPAQRDALLKILREHHPNALAFEATGGPPFREVSVRPL